MKYVLAGKLSLIKGKWAVICRELTDEKKEFRDSLSRQLAAKLSKNAPFELSMVYLKDSFFELSICTGNYITCLYSAPTMSFSPFFDSKNSSRSLKVTVN